MSEVVFGPAVAESTIVDHPFGLDPRLSGDDGGEPAPVWATSQRLRELVERQEALPPGADRRFLQEEILRQLSTVGLYREVVRLLTGPIDPRAAISLYVILFPGEARDNTGIKDLNDKVLGYRLTSEFITARQDEIKTIFSSPDGSSGPRYVTVGQDYKTASIVAVQRTPVDFAKDMAQLDARLRERLLAILAKAEQDRVNADRLPEIKALKRTLERDKNYRFDILFGLNSLPVRSRAIDIVFQLLTEAGKGAGMARFAAKATNLTRVARDVARGRGVEAVTKGHDPRGREFRGDVFLNVSKAANDIKEMMARGPSADAPLDFRSIFVNEVWMSTFLEHRDVYYGNPDVIRDVRKKALREPKLKEGVKFNFTAQKELLELWLVTLNTIDFVKEFVDAEYPRAVESAHVEGLLLLEDMGKQDLKVDWPRLTRFLTRDLRQRFEPDSVQGTASEFQFYSRAADSPEQIFVAMDIRDLGVELMAFYERAHVRIQAGKKSGLDLMRETVQSTDVIVARKRFTYDSVIAAFKTYYAKASERGSRIAAQKAFGTPLRGDEVMPEFRESIHVMLGGDEVFVAAHPYYTEYLHLIIADLEKAMFRDRPLNMRAGVAYSAAKGPLGRSGAASGPLISDAQRREHQKAHDEAFKLAALAPGMLKQLERTHGRIERLIEKLEANDKKKHLAPDYLKKLNDLRLLQHFSRLKYKYSKSLSVPTLVRLRRLLTAEDLPGAEATGLFELVDFAGNTVKFEQVRKQAEALEAAVRKDVGKDNYHVDGPPVTKIPKWMKKLIDDWADQDDEEEEKRKKKKKPSTATPGGVITT